MSSNISIQNTLLAVFQRWERPHEESDLQLNVNYFTVEISVSVLPAYNATQLRPGSLLNAVLVFKDPVENNITPLEDSRGKYAFHKEMFVFISQQAASLAADCSFAKDLSAPLNIVQVHPPCIVLSLHWGDIACGGS